MPRLRRWIIAALVMYNGLVAGVNGFLIVAWPDYQADQLSRWDNLGGALINLGLLGGLVYSYWRQSPTNT